MSQNSNQNVSWQQLSSVLMASELGATPSECHGIICGLICGGINVEDNSWSGAFNDLMNDGLALPAELKKLLKELFDDAVNQFIGGDYQLKLLLNDDNQPLSAVAVSLTQWGGKFYGWFCYRQ